MAVAPREGTRLNQVSVSRDRNRASAGPREIFQGEHTAVHKETASVCSGEGSPSPWSGHGMRGASVYTPQGRRIHKVPESWLDRCSSSGDVLLCL